MQEGARSGDCKEWGLQGVGTVRSGGAEGEGRGWKGASRTGSGREGERKRRGWVDLSVLLTPNNPLKSPSGPIMDSCSFWYLAKSFAHP